MSRSTHQGPDPENAIRFLFEAGRMGSIPRTGWSTELVDPTLQQTVEGHTARMVPLAILLSRMECHDRVHEVAGVALVHDMPETRSGDGDLVSKRYVTTREADIIHDQTRNLGPLGAHLSDLMKMYMNRDVSNTTVRLVKEADNLEMALEIAVLRARGQHVLPSWMKIIHGNIHTPSGKSVLAWTQEWDPATWPEMADIDVRSVRRALASVVLAYMEGEEEPLRFIPTLSMPKTPGNLTSKSPFPPEVFAEYTTDTRHPIVRDAAHIEEVLEEKENIVRGRGNAVAERMWQTKAGQLLYDTLRTNTCDPRDWLEM